MRCPVLLLLVLIGASDAAAQQWAPAQREVWGAVAAMTDRWYGGDMTGLYEYVHPGFIWWNNSNDVPGDYQSARKNDTAWHENAGKFLSGGCTPLTIQVFDDMAVVNTYCRGYRAMPAGQNPQWETVKVLFVMKKEGTKWLQVANYADAGS